MEFRTAFTDVREVWVRVFCFVHTNMCLSVVLFLSFLPKLELSLFPNPPTSTTMEGLLDHWRPYARCRGLHGCTMRCIHPSQRCISSRQMTDNIFEIETTALAHVACAPRDSGILLADFACAYPCVNDSWIFSVLEKAESPEFICRFLRRIYHDSTTHVEFAGTTR